jgi:Yip1 domain
VDVNKITTRAKGMITTPRTEWPIAAAEPDTVGGLFSNYIIWLAALPPIATFLKVSLIGTSVGFLGSFHMPIGWGLEQMVVSYILSLVGVYIGALVVDALAPSFSGQKNPVQALKAVAYGYTAYWVASVAMIVPAIGWLVALLGALYSIYLLNMGLPFTMKCPPEKSVGYTAVTIIVMIVIYFVIGLVVSRVTLMTGLNPYSPAFSSGMHDSRDHGGFVAGSTGAAMDAYAQRIQKAGEQLDAAQKSGDSSAQGAALGAVMTAALGGGASKVEALAPDRLKPFIPDTLGGLPRTQISVERNGALGMQMATGTATYSDGAQHSLQLQIADTGSLKGLVGFAAGYAGAEQDTETDTGYDKIYKSGGELIHEKWDNRSSNGEYGVIVGDRFSVKVSGSAANIGELKSDVVSLNLSGLAALKGEGVQSN